MIGHAISNSRRAGGEVSTKFECYTRRGEKMNLAPVDVLSLCHFRILGHFAFIC